MFPFHFETFDVDLACDHKTACKGFRDAAQARHHPNVVEYTGYIKLLSRWINVLPLFANIFKAEYFMTVQAV